MSKQKSKVLEQKTERFATREVTVSFVKVGDSNWTGGAYAKPQEQGRDADLVLLRRLAATYGLSFSHYSWDRNPINLEDQIVIDEEHFIEIQQDGEVQEFKMVGTRQEWFMQSMAPILEKAGVRVTEKKVTTESEKQPYLASRYQHTVWDEEQGVHDPKVLEEMIGVTVDISELDLTAGTMTIKATSNGEDKNGAALEDPLVESVIRNLHDYVVVTLRDFECWDEDLYTLDCQTNLSAESVRVCDTSFLSVSQAH